MLPICPGFSQDRVNFHRTQGRGTAGWADPSWPTRAGYSIPCAIMLGSGGGGSWAAGTRTRLGRAQRRFSPRERFCSAGSVLLVCFVSSPFLYRCSCSLCLWFCQTALIPTHQFLPVSFHSPPRHGGGRGGRVVLLLLAAAKPEH